MATKKTKTKRSKSGKSRGSRASVSGIVMDTAIAIMSVLGTQAVSKMLVKKDKDTKIEDLAGSGFMPLFPALAGAATPFFLKSQYSKAISIGSSISLIMSLVTIIDAKNEKEGKLTPGKKTLFETLFLTGDDSEDSWNMEDLSPEQRAILAAYALSGGNTDPLGNDPYVMTGKSDPYVMTGDNKDPLS